MSKNDLKEVYVRYKTACIDSCMELEKLLFDYKDVFKQDKKVWLIDAKNVKGEKYKQVVDVRQKNDVLFLLFVLSKYYNKIILYLEDHSISGNVSFIQTVLL